MGEALSLINTTGTGCRIYRDTRGVFVVRHSDHPAEQRLVATLPCAYAVCREWERSASVGRPKTA